MAYQMDLLLLDAAPLSVLAASGIASRAATFGYRWLLSRLYIGAGAVKLLSCDPSWRDLSAVHWHFQSQPLPNPIGAAAYIHLPKSVCQAITFGILVVETISLSCSIYKYLTHCNQYFVWLYEYKANHPKSELMMEYDVVQDEESESREEQAVAPALFCFCGNLDLLEVSVPTSTITNDSGEQESEDDKARNDFKLLLKDHREGIG
jgi:hypothetical protein